MTELRTLQDLFEAELRDVYDAEKQIVKALPRIVKAVSDDGLRSALASHLDETKEHVRRLDRVFESLQLKPRGQHCSGMEGILKEGADLLDADGDPAVLDAAFVAGCQRVEHYEITAYGSLVAWAKMLGHADAVTLLNVNEREEKTADTTLTKLAESTLNAEAAAGGDDDDESATLSAPSRGRRS